MAATETALARDTVSQWVTFFLAEETYGINVMRVQEVLPMTDVEPVPGAPQYVLGIINLRGNVVTVIDTRMQLGLPPQETNEATRIVLLEVRDVVVGILVDRVAEVIEIKQEEIDAAPNVGSHESSRHIHGVVTRDTDLIILLDGDRLLSGGEWGEVAVL